MTWRPTEDELPPFEGTLREAVAREFEWGREYERKIDALSIDMQLAVPYVETRSIGRALYDCASDLIARELVFKPLAEPHEVPDGELVAYRRALYAKRRFYDERERLLEPYCKAICNSLGNIPLSQGMVAEHSPFSLPLYEVMSNLGLLIDQMYYTTREKPDCALFADTYQQLYRNRMFAEDERQHRYDETKLKGPQRSELAPAALVTAYLLGTPYYDMMRTLVPLKFSDQERLSHHLICGGSGSGKTSAMEHCLLHDLASPDRPSVILIDPHSDLVNRLLRADVGLKDRLVYINPRDVEHPPQLNIFAPNERMQGYSAIQREQVSNAAIETFEYLFSGLFDLALTGRQATLLPYLTRLMLAFPAARATNATLFDLLAVTEDIKPFMDVVAKLEPLEQEFFERDFMPKYKDTRQQIQYRLQAIAGNMTLRRLLGSRETKIDLFDALNNGSVILIDTAEDFLGNGSALFGRLWISFILQAILERAALPEQQRRTTYLYIDEAMTFFDEKLAKMLREVRKYRCGVVLATQELPGVSGIRSALSANTGIKMACMVGASDAAALAPDMRTSREFILSQPRLRFATFIQGVTAQAIPISVTPGLINDLPKISDEEHAALIEENRQRVAGPTADLAPLRMTAAPPVSPSSDEDVSRQW